MARPGDTRAQIDDDEHQLKRVLAMIDEATSPAARQATYERRVIEEMEAQMGQRIETRGCSRCGGTMYRTVDVDENGNPTSYPQYVCSNGACGNVEG
ncbi:hypothetical protein [Streptomyces sp. NPDC048057]|uniref:hypothetical protein n=1 Tax=Streptomyces sp. NPDC048057 TaxID=3155628 RepID=UPI0033C132D2